MSLNIVIKYAVYGGNDGVCQARNITQAVQKKINNGESQVVFDNANFGDAAVSRKKGFGVVAQINGEEYVYSGAEGDTVDFSQMPINGEGRDNLKVTGLNVHYHPSDKQLFNGGHLDIQNLSYEAFPNDAHPSAWVWLDFYFVESNEPLQEAASYTKIGEIPVSITSAIAYRQAHRVQIEGFDLYDMAKYLLDTRRLVNAGDYYLYVQVRNEEGRINPSIGAFSSEIYAYSVS